MALTDEQKLEIARSAFKEKLYEIKTWDEFKTLLNTITKVKIKNFIKNNLQKEADRKRQYALDENSSADDVETLITEIGGDLK